MNKRTILIYALLVTMLLTMAISGQFIAAATPMPTSTLAPTQTLLSSDGLLRDTSLLTHDPACLPPCWHGIIPGQTQWDDALSILKADPQLENVNLVGNPQAKGDLARFQQKGGGVCCELFTADRQIVGVISLKLAPNITLEQLIAAQGNPTYIMGDPYAPGQTAIPLLYPDRGLTTEVSVTETGGVLRSSDKITSVTYSSPADFNTITQVSKVMDWNDYSAERAGTPMPTSTFAPTETAQPLRDDTLLHDTSLIDALSTCLPPCWHGIVPGVTSWKDALAILKSDGSLETTNLQSDSTTTTQVEEFQSKAGTRCCQIFTEDRELVNVIFLRVTPKMRLSQLITAQGNPEYVVGSPYSNDQAVLNLIYTDKALVVYVFVAGTSGSLSASSEVVGVLYMTPADMDLLINTSSLYDWKGYQSYETYAEGVFDVTPSMTVTPTPHP